MARGRLSAFFEETAAKDRAAGSRSVPDLKLTPMMSAELREELGYEADTFHTCQGVHKLKRIYCHTRALGDNVILAPREDLFSESDADVGVQMVSLANSVTSVPDNMGCCEVISCGELVDAVKPGDVAFIDFIRVKQGYIIENEELYIAGGDAFCGLYDVAEQAIKPLDNYVVTAHRPDRFKVALTGTDRIHVLDMVTTTGIVSGRTSTGGEAAHTLYQEIVSMGRITTRPRPGQMTKAERLLLDALFEDPQGLYHGNFEINALLDVFVKERMTSRVPDVEVGDLVAFCEEIGQKIRVRGERQYLVPYENVLAAIDDGAILTKAIREDRAGTIIRSA